MDQFELIGSNMDLISNLISKSKETGPVHTDEAHLQLIFSKNHSQFMMIFILFLLSNWIFPKEAQASYLDPGLGSYVLQYIIAFLIGIFFVIKNYGGRIKHWIVNLFMRRKNKKDKDNE